jgi:hypothetical protein
MKKSKIISLVLISAALASCHKPKPKHQHVYLRSDASAPYSQVNTNNYSGGNNALLWYYAFRPYGSYSSGSYHRSGYYSSGISESSNIGHSSAKSSVVRGGFGGGHFSVSS